jgi:hypothetical protein
MPEMMMSLARENLDIAAGLAREIANAPRPPVMVEEEWIDDGENWEDDDNDDGRDYASPVDRSRPILASRGDLDSGAVS